MTAQGTLLQLYFHTMQIALTLVVPVVVAIAVIGVVVSVAQTVVGIQDQNLSFGPKITIVALLLVVAGPAAIALLAQLLLSAIAALPHLAT